jgi:hypothetical protein
VAQSSAPASTTNTDFDKKYRKSHTKTNNKKIRYILKKNTQNTSYGNPCVVEITRSKGFEYLVTLKGQPGYESEIQRGFHNFGVNVSLFFRNGPFWKSGLKKKILDCRHKSGDYVGYLDPAVIERCNLFQFFLN